MRAILFALALVVVFAPATRREANAGIVQKLFVNSAVAASGDGETWATAYKELHEALDRPGGHEIWVAQGTYTPKVPAAGLLTARRAAATFVVGGDEQVYGGFVGGETDRGQRDPGAHPVVLSGEILAAGPADNAYTVLTFPPAANVNTVIDGVTIRDANEDRVGEKGGGIENAGGSPGIENVIIRDNFAPQGAGIHSTGGTLTLLDMTFLNNLDVVDGSPQDLLAAGGTVSLSDATFTFDRPTAPGGSFVKQRGTAAISLARVSFRETTAHSSVGVDTLGTGARTLVDLLFDGVTVGVSIPQGDATIERATFVNIEGTAVSLSDGVVIKIVNSTFGPMNGNAIFGIATSGDLDLEISHSTFADIGTGAVLNLLAVTTIAHVTLSDSVIWGDHGGFEINDFGPPPNSTLTIEHSVLEGGCPTLPAFGVDVSCEDLITTDPLLGPVAENGGFAPTASIGVGSPAVDAGSVTPCPAVDERGLARPFDGNEDGTAQCDLGAYELRPQHAAFSAAASSKKENAGTATVVATLDAPAGIPVTATYEVVGGTATAGKDFTLAPGTLTFAPGETSKTFAVTLLDDLLVEPGETVVARLATISGALPGADRRHTLTITDDEPRLKCDGKTATRLGTQGNDTIVGTAGDDVIVSRGGVDDVRGLGGKDTICAGPGNDVVNGGGGNDFVSGQGGNDTLTGGPGADRLSGGGGSDTVAGSGGNDTIDGGIAADQLRGNGGNDRIGGAGGDDVLRGDGGNDQLQGGLGEDRLSGGAGTSDRCDGGPGSPDVLVSAHGCEVVVGVP